MLDMYALNRLNADAGYVRGTPVKTTEYISIRCVTAFYGFRPYGGSLLANSPKSKQKVLAPAYGPRCAQVPSLRSCSMGTLRRAILGPIAALPASMPVDPLRRTSTRPPERGGRSRSKTRSRSTATATATATSPFRVKNHACKKYPANWLSRSPLPHTPACSIYNARQWCWPAQTHPRRNAHSSDR